MKERTKNDNQQMISKAKIWLMAIRPKTLPAGIAPVLMGTAMALGDGVHDGPTALVCLGVGVMIQIATNLANDYFDFQKGADTTERIGPTRVMQAGLVKPKEMKCAMVLAFGLAAIGCILLVLRTGWPIAVLGILSILSGIFYTAGSRPLGYLGLGEVFVLIFFGPVAVGGTYYVQSFEINMVVVLAGIAAGLWSSAVLAVNNLRDIDSDRRCGKRTLAVRFGRVFAQYEYTVCVIAAALMPVLIYVLIQDHREILISVLTIFAVVPGIRTVFSREDGPALNKTLAFTGMLLMLFSILFSIGWIYGDIRI
jgi:1,4-dihydroxy-2-naphthoate octaprenyltransferase